MNSAKSGSALMMTMIYMAVCIIISGTFVVLASTTRNWSQRELYREQAFSAAEAGLEAAAQNITTNVTIPSINALATSSGTVGGRPFAYGIKSVTNAPYVYSIASTSTVGGVKRVVRVDRAEKPTFAKYALWMDINGVVYFFGGEQFNGPVHSNDRLYFQMANGTGAKFYSDLTSATNAYSGDLTGTYFANGFQLNVTAGKMADVSFPNLLNIAHANGLVLTGTTSITMNGNQVRVTNPRKGWTNQNYSVNGDAIIYVKQGTGTPTNTAPAIVSIGGRLDGRLSIVSDDDFLLTNHITYATDPRTNYSDDALGLIAKDDVLVATNAPNNLNLFAAMMATGQITNNNGSFSVINYDKGTGRGSLNVYGSIIQEVRGIVNLGGGTTGYAKNYSFDSRFSVYAPPFYPRLSTKVVYQGWTDSGI